MDGRLRVNIAYYRETHIDPESGHEQVLAGLRDRADVAVLDPCLPRALPDWVRDRLAPPLGEHRKMTWYEPSALPLEYAAARKVVTSPGEVVHLFQGEPHFNYSSWVRYWPRRRGAYVTTFHQPPEMFEEVWRFRHKRGRLDALDGMTVLSRVQRDYFRELVGDRVTFVPFGVNRRVFNPPGERPERGEVHCITVGSWLRDPVLMRETIERVASANDAVRFTVLAPPAYLEQLGRPPKTKVGSGVYGRDLVAAYHDADLFIHPARLSSASTAMLEGMACGLPIVVPDVGGVRDYVDDQSAELVPPGDPDAMADAVLGLAGDRARRLRMGAAADEQSYRLDWAFIAEQYVQVYRRALERRS